MKKQICLIIAALFCSIVFAGCDSAETPAATDTTEQLQALQNENNTLRTDNQQLQSENEALHISIQKLLEEAKSPGTENTDTVDTENLLLSVCQSNDTLTYFPAHITHADATETGYTLSFDRLEFNPDFTPGGDSEDGYLLNNSEEIEQIDTNFVYIQYIEGLITEVDDAFARYVSADGGDFTFFMLGDNVIYISEILVP